MSRKTIFVLGAPRSGTSLILYMLINDQPRMVGSKFESQFYTISMKKPFVLSTFLDDPYFNDLLGADKTRELFAQSTSHLDFFKKAILFKLDDSGKDHFIEKSPMHTVYYNDIYKNFENVSFVLINRKPAANIQSIAFTKWINLLSDKFPFGLSKVKWIRYLFASLLFHEYWKDSKLIEKHPATIATFSYEDIILEKVNVKAVLDKGFGFEMAPLYVSRPFSDAVKHKNHGFDKSRVEDYKEVMPKYIQNYIEMIFEPKSIIQKIVRIPFLILFYEPVYLIKKTVMGKK